MTAGMKRKNCPSPSASNSSMQTSSILSTNFSNLFPGMEKDKDSDMEEDATTCPSSSVGANSHRGYITLNSSTDVVVPPPMMIDKPPSGIGFSPSPCWPFFMLFDPLCHPELEKYVQCMLCDTKISHGSDSLTGGMNTHLMFKH